MNPFKISLTFIVLLAVLSSKSNCQETPWQNIGPYMGYVHCMAMDTSHADTVYAGTPTGVYKSVDGAETWTKTSLTDFEINALKISPNNPNLLIASSDTIVYKSEDYGETWDEIWRSELTIGAIAIDPADDLSIWAGVNVSGYKVYTQNLYHTEDGGDNWEAVAWGEEETKLQSVLSIHFDHSNESVMYVCGWGDTYHVDGGIFVSNDKGKTWTNHRPGGCSSNNVLAVATTAEGYEPHAAYILVSACSLDKKLFKSLDNGVSWEELEPASTDYIDRFAYVMEFDPEPGDRNRLYFGGNYKSEASIMAYNIEAETWHYLPGTPLYNPTSLLMHPKVWYMGFKRDGVFRAAETDTSWVSKIKGMTDVKTYDVMTYPNDGDKIQAAIEGSLAKTTDGGNTWELTDNSYGRLALNPLDTSIIYAGAVSSYLPNPVDSYYGYKSINGGDSWSSKKLFTRGGLVEYGYTFRTGDILVFPDNPDHILFGVDGGSGAGEGLFRSINGGDSWVREFSTGVTPIALDPANHDIVYLGTTKPGAVHRSINGGQSWDPLGGLAYIISDLGIDINGQVVAATSDGLFKWDGNETWSLVPGFPEISTTAIAIDNRPALPVYYVGTEEQGVFVSEDGGSTWDSFNEGLKKSNITRLRLTDSSPRNLYAGTEDGGVWKTTLKKDATSIRILKEPEISLSIFPNPNDGTFSITSNADSELRGEIKIINLLGKIVYADNSFYVSPGSAQVINLDNVSPGNYVLVFTNNSFTINKKVIISSTR